MKPIVRLSHVSKTYRRSSLPVCAVKDLSLELNPETFTAIIGKSGCGKTTVINLIGGLLHPESGHIVVEGIPVNSLSAGARADFRKQKIGFVFQNFDLIQDLTARENILLPFTLNGEIPDLNLFAELTEKLELSDCLDAWPAQLSGGQQQRVSIARALIRKPAILLADEPTGNLDRKSGIRVMKLFQDCQRQFGQTVLMVTHDMDLAKKADRILVMEDGRIIQEITREKDCCEVSVNPNCHHEGRKETES